MSILSFILVLIISLVKWKESVQLFYRLYTLIGLILLLFCTYLKPGLGFPMLSLLCSMR